jgi:cytoskeletal protein CcmA (bactofilin family)
MNDIVTIVGEQTVIKGNLKGDEDLQVRGRVEGSIQLSKTLLVEKSGIVLANISVEDAIVSGIVVGNVTAANSVQITQEGRMVGDIAAPRVIIVDGASFRGHVDMGNLEGTRERPSLPPAPMVPPRALGTRPGRPATQTQPRPTLSVRKPTGSEPRPERPAPAKPAAPTSSRPATSAPARPTAPAPSSRPGPAAPARPESPGRRPPPKPPAIPVGKRKIKRR